MSTQKRLRSNPVLAMRGIGQGFGLPCPSKFQSEHLPSGKIPVSRAIHVSGSDSKSGSDMDTGSDSDGEVYGVKCSVNLLPKDEKIPNSLHRNSEDKIHSNFRSPRDVIQQKKGNHVERLAGGGVRTRVEGSGYTVEEPLDSVSSFEVSSRLLSNSNAGVPKGYRLAGDHSGHLQPNMKIVTIQICLGCSYVDKSFHGCCSQGLQNKKLADDDAPSAPPLAGSVQEFNQVTEELLNFRGSGTPCPESSTSSAITDEANVAKRVSLGSTMDDSTANRISDPLLRTGSVSSSSVPTHFPTFHASGLGPWHAVISYDACVWLCLHSWARGCREAPIFLENECQLLRNAFGLQQVLLQSEEELLRKRSMELVSEGAALKVKNFFGKMKVQVRKVKMDLDPPIGCSFSSLKSPMVKLGFHLSNVKSTLSSEWEAIRKVRVSPQMQANDSFSHQSLAYVYAGTRYLKEVSGLLKTGVSTFHSSSSSYEVVQETYSCSLRLKSLSEEDAVRMQPGSGETHVFFPDGLGDDLVIDVFDSKGRHYGRVVAQVADIADDPGDKLRWWPMYHEPEHEMVGRIQLSINYSTSLDENSTVKCGSVAETVAYNMVLEAALKAQHFCQRNLLLHGSWRWLLTEFALFYGVSDAYTKVRYLAYVMDVATPTADCLNLVHDLLSPVIKKDNIKCRMSHQENRILGEVSDQIEQAIALVFENYKTLDESSPSGMMDIFRPATNVAAPALGPALKLYHLLHDICSFEAQLKLCRYFQTAVRKRSRRSLAETDEFVSGNNENILMDPVKLSAAYQKMVSLCFSIRNEIFTDREIQNQHLLPSFIDLPNLSSFIYGTELCNRLRAFLGACPPAGPSPPVTELVIATADFQRDIACWNINPTKGSVDAKELFHSYISHWIQDKHLSLLESCKIDQVKWSSVRTADSTTPFVDYMYNRLNEMLRDYEVIICLWPEYVCFLESAIADVERAIVETLDRQYTDVLSPLKDNMIPIKLGLKYVQKIAKGNVFTYTVPNEIEVQLKSWGSSIPDGGDTVPGELLSEVTVMLRTKFRNYLQAVVEKLAENTRLHSATKLKNIIQDTKEDFVESDVRSRMQPLKDLLTKTIDHLHSIAETQVFLIICRGFWDRMGHDILRFLENRKGNSSCYKGARAALSVLDDMCASQMQKLLGNSLHEKDLEPPRSIIALHSMLCKDAGNHGDNNYFY